MLLIRVCWFRFGFQAFEDRVNGQINAGYRVMETYAYSGFLGLRWVMVAIMVKCKHHEGAGGSS